MDLAVNAVIAVLLALSAWFGLRYTTTFRWWENFEGRALVTASAGWTVLFGALLADDIWNIPTWGWLLVAVPVLAGAVLKVAMVENAIRSTAPRRQP